MMIKILEFLKQVDLVYKMAINLDISIFHMPGEIERLKSERTDLKIEYSILEQQYDQKMSKYNFVIKQLRDMGVFLRGEV
jgi:hypothetical protein